MDTSYLFLLFLITYLNTLLVNALYLRRTCYHTDYEQNSTFDTLLLLGNVFNFDFFLVLHQNE